jgi:hypothetical protein
VNPPIYDAVVAHFHGFDPERVLPTPTADELVANSYADQRRRHARDRARDEHGRFLPAAPRPMNAGWDVVAGEVVKVGR